MKEEIFGPVLPVLSYIDFSDVIKKHIKTKDKPLAIYYFGHSSNPNYKSLLNSTSSGNLTCNDILAQVLSIDLGFGGVGGSGYGRYGGYEGFK